MREDIDPMLDRIEIIFFRKQHSFADVWVV